MKKCVVILIVFLLGATFVFPQEAAKFPTKQVRELWQVCSITFRTKNPGVGPNVYFPVCDCYMDHIRANYTPTEVMYKMTKEKYTQLTLDLRATCNPKTLLKPPEVFTKWEYRLKTFPATSYPVHVVEKTNSIRKL